MTKQHLNDCPWLKSREVTALILDLIMALKTILAPKILVIKMVKYQVTS